MTTLGAVENVERTRYLDEATKTNIYPLDIKIDLHEIEGRRSRYTNNFGQLSGEYYALMPERDVQRFLNKTLCIKLELDSIVRIGAAIAAPHLPKLYDEAESDEAVQQQVIMGEPGFIEKKIQDINISPERDFIILNALKKGVNGTERNRIETDLTIAYVEADGTGVSGLPHELSEKGKNGGPAKTFEVKIGVLFTQSFSDSGLPLLENGRIFRDVGSTRYMGTTEKIAQFTLQLDAFTRMNGIYDAQQIVFLSDGAVWLEKLREKLFPRSIGVIDLFHARQHLHELIDSFWFYGSNQEKAFYDKCAHLLDLGEIDQMISLITQKITKYNKESVEKQLVYFISNKEKMRYGLFRAAGLFIGSGVVESACKTIVENRLNGSGMRWTKKNAANVVALRSAFYSGKNGIGAAA